MERPAPRPRGGDVKTRQFRFEIFVTERCPHSQRLKAELRKNAELSGRCEVKDALQLKREGKLYPWLRKLPTIIDHLPIVKGLPGQPAKHGEPMVYQGSEAFAFLKTWFPETGRAIPSKRFRQKGFSPAGGSNGMWNMPSSIKEATFGKIDEAKLREFKRNAQYDTMGMRKAVDELAKRQAESASVNRDRR